MGLLDKVERMAPEREAAAISPQHAAVLVETREILQRTVSALTEQTMNQAGFLVIRQAHAKMLPDDQDSTQPLPAIVGRFWVAEGCVLTDQGKLLLRTPNAGGRIEVDPDRDLRPLRGEELLDTRDAGWVQDGDARRWISPGAELDPWMIDSMRTGMHGITPEGSAGLVTWEFLGGGYRGVIVPLEQWADALIASIAKQ